MSHDCSNRTQLLSRTRNPVTRETDKHSPRDVVDQQCTRCSPVVGARDGAASLPDRSRLPGGHLNSENLSSKIGRRKIPDCRSPFHIPRFKSPDSGFWILDSTFPISISKFPAPKFRNLRFQIGFPISLPESQILDSRFHVPHSRFPPPLHGAFPSS